MSNVKPRSKQPPGCNLGAPYQPSLINPYITNQPGFLQGRSQRPKVSATDLRKCTSNDVLSIRKLVVLSESLGPWGSSLPFRSHSWSPFNQSGGFVKGGPRMPKILRHSLSLYLSHRHLPRLQQCLPLCVVTSSGNSRWYSRFGCPKFERQPFWAKRTPPPPSSKWSLSKYEIGQPKSKRKEWTIITRPWIDGYRGYTGDWYYQLRSC